MLSKRNCALILVGAAILVAGLMRGSHTETDVREKQELSQERTPRIQQLPDLIADIHLVPVLYEGQLENQLAGDNEENSFIWKPLPKKDWVAAPLTHVLPALTADAENDFKPLPRIASTDAIPYAPAVTTITDIVPAPPLAASPETSQKPVPLRRFVVSEAVAHKAVHHIEYGKTLSRRGASFAARQEFFRGLSLVAQAIDSVGPERGHSQALDNAVVAIREAKDFFVGNNENQIGLNIVGVLETHRSKIVNGEDARAMTPVNVIQRYFSYAEEQLTVASGHSAVAAEALYCLGKLHYVMSKQSANSDRLDVAKSIMFHRSALACDSGNFRSANELGTLLARSGRMEEAKVMLKHSLIIEPTAQAWGNLAVIHERMGERRLSQLARSEYAQTLKNPPGAASNMIRWVAPTQFNEGANPDLHSSTARLPESPVTTPALSSSPEPSSDPSSWFNKFKSLF